MAQPRAYIRNKDFTADFGNETDHSALNAELDAAGNSINDIRTNLAILQADDGKLRPNVVTVDSIDDSVRDDLSAGIVLQVQGSVDAAAASASAAAASAADSLASKTAAANSETSATDSATSAAASASSASASAATATTKASEATDAAASAVGSAGTAGTAATNAAASASSASTSASSASSAATTATAKAGEASTSATNAAESASSASTSASNAASSATAAATSATQAATSAAAINVPQALTGKALNLLRVKADESGYEHRTALQARSDIGAAASGSNSDITALTALASVNGGPLAGTRNRLINGNFAINQRGVSGTVTLAAGAYGHDRWKAGASGCTYTFAASGNDTGITITAGSLQQVVEGVNVESAQYTLNNGGGTAQMRIGINGAAPSGAYSDGPITTATVTAGQNITVEFSTGTVGKVQLERGTTASYFERRLYGMELALCQRYYEKGNVALRTNGTGSGGNGTFISFAEPKRTTPTIVYSSTTYTYGCSGISSNPFANGFECFVSATGACAFASVWETSGAEL